MMALLSALGCDVDFYKDDATKLYVRSHEVPGQPRAGGITSAYKLNVKMLPVAHSGHTHYTKVFGIHAFPNVVLAVRRWQHLHCRTESRPVHSLSLTESARFLICGTARLMMKTPFAVLFLILN